MYQSTAGRTNRWYADELILPGSNAFRPEVDVFGGIVAKVIALPCGVQASRCEFPTNFPTGYDWCSQSRQYWLNVKNHWQKQLKWSVCWRIALLTKWPVFVVNRSRYGLQGKKHVKLRQWGCSDCRPLDYVYQFWIVQTLVLWGCRAGKASPGACLGWCSRWFVISYSERIWGDSSSDLLLGEFGTRMWCVSIIPVLMPFSLCKIVSSGPFTEWYLVPMHIHTPGSMVRNVLAITSDWLIAFNPWTFVAKLRLKFGGAGSTCELLSTGDVAWFCDVHNTA